MNNYGFTLITEQQLREVDGSARLWRHEATGAQLLSISNTDENKCFGVSFRTPPTDSTGVAHILEHSVLCGSDKYPVKEPFVELLKGSLQTFLNAFTFPDKTCYPVASCNLRDFYNLIDVYIDAVFHPRINEDIFKQEGWHVDAPSADGPWAYKGVVYNEMKGVYSSPDSVLAEQSQQALFPDTLYSLDSGGNPQCIPDLTYEAFRDFHSRYYHPSNARFFFWGDDPEAERLRIAGQALEQYAARPVDSTVPLQARIDTPRHIEVPYAASEGEKRALFTVNWLLGERGDVNQALLMEMLEHILEGLPGSPLRKALIASGLGEDTTGCGLETDLRQMYYSTGLKGVAPRDVPAAEVLIFETLAQLAEEGIPAAAVEAAVNTVEFAYRENNSGRFPRGLSAMIQSLSTWLYDGDPLAPLAWEAPLAALKKRIKAGEPVFEQAIKDWFLNNNHRATVVLLPDTGLGKARDAAEKARVDAVQAAAGPAERAAV
ncbi:insulinase family protein, partial [Desulfovibrio sp. 1188_IL3213]|uniref:insulinase family protein n=1 Tax=Desulfovibrio sp. 1188_IL3213 TaxID=3084052 RepID=UPI002FD8FD85